MFEVVFELKVNLPKCKMMSVRDIPDLNSLETLFGCLTADLPKIYLGLPLSAKVKSKQLWDPVMARVKQRLETWKGKYLSKCRRITLIKSALSNLPMYFMSLFRAPSAMLHKLEKIRVDFLWHL